jgi:type IV pilus assembly protein PilN
MGLALVLAAATVLAATGFTERAIDEQNARNDYLKREIAEADRKIKEIEDLERVKKSLISRMRVIEQLQASRTATVHFFDELVTTLPEGVNLISVKQAGEKVTIEGLAESNGRVSTYMKNLDESPWFTDPRLVVIKTDPGNARGRKSSFTLEVSNLTRAQTDADAGAGGP